MYVCEESPLGYLEKERGGSKINVAEGRVFSVGSLKGIPQWQKSLGPQILFIATNFGPGVFIAKEGKQQAGAFILKPDESFEIGSEEVRTETYRFRASRIIKVIVENKKAVCTFCRRRLPGHGFSPSVTGELRGQIFCRECADVEVWSCSETVITEF